MVLAAFAMQSFFTKCKIEMEDQNKPAFEMRVGIHTGPVVAGVLRGQEVSLRHLGHTVNTTSRLESSGEVGKVNVSESAYELLKNNIDFAFENRGKIEAKGKGEVPLYFVKLADQ
jgi:adenylate cyclase